MLGHKVGIITLKKTEIIKSTFSNDNIIKVEITNKRKAENFKIFENNILLKQPMGQRKDRKVENTARQMKTKIQHNKTYRMQ